MHLHQLCAVLLDSIQRKLSLRDLGLQSDDDLLLPKPQHLMRHRQCCGAGCVGGVSKSLQLVLAARLLKMFLRLHELPLRHRLVLLLLLVGPLLPMLLLLPKVPVSACKLVATGWRESISWREPGARCNNNTHPSRQNQ
jgi:hypothetical protein